MDIEIDQNWVCVALWIPESWIKLKVKRFGYDNWADMWSSPQFTLVTGSVELERSGCVWTMCELGPGTTGREVRILRLPFCVVQNLCKVRRFHSCFCYVFYCYFDAKIFELNRNSYSRAGEFWCILLMLSWRVSWYSSHGHWWSRRTWCCAGWHGTNVI